MKIISKEKDHSLQELLALAQDILRGMKHKAGQPAPQVVIKFEKLSGEVVTITCNQASSSKMHGNISKPARI